MLPTSSKPDNYRISPTTQDPVTEVMSLFKDMSVFQDWSGRGSHVDFLPDEILPLKEGRFLGYGIMGGVYETAVGDWTFAWKRRFCRRKITDEERKEIEILKKLSHEHVIQLVGTYTHRQFLGLLLSPVAVCDLATYFEDYEAVLKDQELVSAQKERFLQLKLPFESKPDFKIAGQRYLYSRIGCLTHAVEYLHSQKVRHKDLKPSNILISENGLWLTDFGTATDFSLLSSSATENCERGTPKYFAPEVAKHAPSGRSADIFSLGCILLEISHLLIYSTLQSLRDCRPDLDMSFQTNIHRINDWFPQLSGYVDLSPQIQHLLLEIRRMLAIDPQNRPSATELCKHMGFIDQFSSDDSGFKFDECCRAPLMSVSEHEMKMAVAEDEMEDRIERISHDRDKMLMEFKYQIHYLTSRIAELEMDKVDHLPPEDPQPRDWS